MSIPRKKPVVRKPAPKSVVKKQPAPKPEKEKSSFMFQDDDEELDNIFDELDGMMDDLGI